MPHDDPVDRGITGDAQPGLAERFTARNSPGHAVAVEQVTVSVGEDAIGGIVWSHAPSTAFRLENGQPVERVEESTYPTVRTGELRRREEGDHGITHHLQHPSAGG
ncbi:hypothetical protein [Acidovorax sp. BL-A-41-H1]|uniref:hypothetical protein n=1 Tax=Acidovorax sp. BL-A-41-H1 TaxID=3421102 RepID=UPI003F79667B